MRFEEIYLGWSESRLTQEEAALILGVCDRTFRRYIDRYEEGTASSFQGVRGVIIQKGLFSSLYTDRGSHYWFTPKEGGKVSKTQLTQFGRAMKSLGIQMIAAYSPEARGRSERAFGTHQDRLVKELALHRIPIWMPPTDIWPKCIYPRSTPSSCSRPLKMDQRLSLGWGKISMTSSVNKMSGPSAPTTASASREGNCKSRQINIAATTSGSRCGSIGIWMVHWPSFMVRESWLIMTGKEN